MKARVRVAVVVFALLWVALWTLIPADPGPPPKWRHMHDVAAIVSSDGSYAYCPLSDYTIVEPGDFCTGEGWDPE